MADTDKVFGGSIPEIYDTYLVPLIFEEFAEDLSARVVAANPTAVLETAAGSGVVTRALAKRLSTDAAYTVTDLNQPMLDRAAARQGEDQRLTWQQADALVLPFDDDSFDVVLCQFGVMFFPDRIAGYREALRVLRPGGHFIFNSWDHIRENEFADVVTTALASIFPDDPPMFMARTPHGYHNAAVIEADLLAAGYASIEIETKTAVSEAPLPSHPAIAYCRGTPLRNEIEARDAAKLEYATTQATAAIEVRYGAGPVRGKIQGHIATARKPG